MKVINFSVWIQIDPPRRGGIFLLLKNILPPIFKGGNYKTGAFSSAASEGPTPIATETLGKHLDERFARSRRPKRRKQRMILGV